MNTCYKNMKESIGTEHKLVNFILSIHDINIIA